MSTIEKNLKDTIYSSDSISTAVVNQLIYAINKEQERRDYWDNVRDVKKALCGKISYVKWILLYDLIHESYSHINCDIARNKISKEDVSELIDRCNSIKQIFNKPEILSQIR